MRRHPGTFVAGLLFIAIGIAYVLQGLDLWDVRPGRLWPIVLIVIGAMVLLTGRLERTATEQAGPDESQDGETPQPS